MKKKSILNSISLLFSFSLLFLISCESLEEKTDEAYEDAKESKVFTDDSLESDSVSDLAILDKPKLKNKLIIVDSWVKYAREIESEIKNNENSIADLRLISGTSVKTFKQITALEEKNQELRSRLIDYDTKSKTELEIFKLEMASDMKNLNLDLDKLSVNLKVE